MCSGPLEHHLPIHLFPLCSQNTSAIRDRLRGPCVALIYFLRFLRFLRNGLGALQLELAAVDVRMRASSSASGTSSILYLSSLTESHRRRGVLRTPAARLPLSAEWQPGIDDEDTHCRDEGVRQLRAPHPLPGRKRLIRGCLRWWGQLHGEGTQCYEHACPRPAKIPHRTRDVGLVEGAVSVDAVQYHERTHAERQHVHGASESTLTGTQSEYRQAGDQHDVGQRIGYGHDLRECRLSPLLDDWPENEVPAEGDGRGPDHQTIEGEARAGGDGHRASRQQQDAQQEERI